MVLCLGKDEVPKANLHQGQHPRRELTCTAAMGEGGGRERECMLLAPSVHGQPKQVSSQA